jgi:hypothetical protein
VLSAAVGFTPPEQGLLFTALWYFALDGTDHAAH